MGKTPLLVHFFHQGSKYQNDSKFEYAIEEFKHCLSHPSATEENKVASLVLIGLCYYDLNEPKQAEKNYREALSISKRVKKEEKLKARLTIFHNLGFIYLDFQKTRKALKHFKESLGLFKQTGRGSVDIISHT